MVDVTTDEPVNFKPHGFFVGGDGGGDDTRVGVVDFRAAVLGLEDIGPRLHAVAFRIFRAGGVDRFGEIQCEAVGVGGHGLYFKGCLARPLDALKGERLAAARRPTSVRSTSEDDTGFAIITEWNDAGFEVFEEMKNSTLIDIIDLLETNALDL